MAINVSSLTAYTEEHKLPLIRKAVIGFRSGKEMNLMTGVKGATALNLLDTDVTLQDGSACGWNEAGATTLSQRIVTPGYVKVNMAFCEKSLLKTWANYDVRIAAGQKTLPFEEDFINGAIEGIGAKMEKAIWADEDHSTLFDGMIKVAEEANVPAYTYSTGATVTSILNGVYGKLKSEVFEKGDVVAFIGADAYRQYVQELIANGNLVLNAGNGAVLDGIALPSQMLIPGTNVTVIPVAGLDGTGKVLASYRDNFVYAVDMADDNEKFEFWYSQDNREFRLAVEFLAGVQIAHPELAVEGKLA